MKRALYIVVVALVAATWVMVEASPSLAKAPLLTRAAWWLSYQSQGDEEEALTFVNARFTVTDDSKGKMTIRVCESQPGLDWTNTRTYQRRAPRSYGLASRVYKLRWSAPDDFWGGGIYKVRIQVRDSEGKWSRSVSHTWNIGD